VVGSKAFKVDNSYLLRKSDNTAKRGLAGVPKTLSIVCEKVCY